jgi:transcription-repair coupling factor (superfamily II helicase)
VAAPPTRPAPAVVVAGVRALLQKLGPGAAEIEPIVVAPNAIVDPDELGARLVAFGYRREELVEHRGEFARRGAIVDVFPSTADAPIRIDLWGDEVDRLTTFSVNDQRSIADLDEARASSRPASSPRATTCASGRRLVATEPWGREQWERLAEGTHFDGMESWVPWLVDDDRLLTDLLPDTAKVVLVEPRRMRDRATDLLAEEDDLAKALASTWARDADKEFPRLHAEPDRLLATVGAFWTIDSTPESPDTPVVLASGWGPRRRRRERAHPPPHRAARPGLHRHGRRRRHRLGGRLREILLDHGSTSGSATGPGKPGTGAIVVAPLHRGCTSPTPRWRSSPRPTSPAAAAPTAPPAPGSARAPPPSRTSSPATTWCTTSTASATTRGWSSARSAVSSATTCSSRTRAATSSTCRPTRSTRCASTSAARRPTLHRLGGSDFAKSKSRVRSAVREIAQELVVLYQKRVNATGHAFGHDTPWQHEMEEAFPYVETPDQKRAIDDIKADMERPTRWTASCAATSASARPRSRSGRRSRRSRTASRSRCSRPTTLLAPASTATPSPTGSPGTRSGSRCCRASSPPAQAKQVIAGLKSGEVDCVIGTHRLLSADITFKDLGLLVVDEEQRFGVQHKEQIKKLKTNVDVLTLSATPIPRTLEMSLVGIRDLSLLQTPPADRQPILTFVGEYDERVAVEAIRRELLREGQVFWVHNRVRRSTPPRPPAPARARGAHRRRPRPDGRGHARAGRRRLLGGRYDVLVCTTIIESGIDMPTVNTLVVERADLLGLGQMHQLRGRVGRSGSGPTPTCSTPRTVLTEEAYERLKTIGEATELGSGFKIAMRDLEIRGAGNLLGESQSGHIAAVGYDLYCQMVTEAVVRDEGRAGQAAGRDQARRPHRRLPAHRLRRPRRSCGSRRTAASPTSRARPPSTTSAPSGRTGTARSRRRPRPCCMVGRLRAECHRLGITDMQITGSKRDGGQARLSPIDLKLSESMRLKRMSKGAIHKEDQRQLVVPIPRGQDPAGFLADFLRQLFPPAEPDTGGDRAS